MKQTLEFKKASLVRRFFATIFDLLISGVVFFLLLAFIVQPIFVSTTSYDKNLKEYNRLMVESHLYYEDYGQLYYINKDYDENLTYFFSTYDNVENYYKLKLDSGLFVCNDETKVCVENGNEEKMKAFYKSAITKGVEIINKDPDISKLSAQINSLTIVMVLICLVPSLIISMLIPMLLFKNGETLGLKFMHIKIMSKKGDPTPTKIQNLFRFLIFMIIEIILSLYTFGLVFIASIISVFATKDHQTICDLLTSTFAVDGSTNIKNIAPSEKILIVYDDGLVETNKEENDVLDYSTVQNNLFNDEIEIDKGDNDGN